MQLWEKPSTQASTMTLHIPDSQQESPPLPVTSAQCSLPTQFFPDHQFKWWEPTAAPHWTGSAVTMALPSLGRRRNWNLTLSAADVQVFLRSQAQITFNCVFSMCPKHVAPSCLDCNVGWYSITLYIILYTLSQWVKLSLVVSTASMRVFHCWLLCFWSLHPEDCCPASHSADRM